MRGAHDTLVGAFAGNRSRCASTSLQAGWGHRLFHL